MNFLEEKTKVLTKTKMLSPEVVVSNSEYKTAHYCGANRPPALLTRNPIFYAVINRIHI